MLVVQCFETAGSTHKQLDHHVGVPVPYHIRPLLIQIRRFVNFDLVTSPRNIWIKDAYLRTSGDEQYFYTRTRLKSYNTFSEFTEILLWHPPLPLVKLFMSKVVQTIKHNYGLHSECYFQDIIPIQGSSETSHTKSGMSHQLSVPK